MLNTACLKGKVVNFLEYLRVGELDLRRVTSQPRSRITSDMASLTRRACFVWV